MMILVAVDGSEGSAAALRWARRFADQMGASMGAVRAWEYPSSAVLPGGPSLRGQDEVTAEVTSELTRFLRDELAEGAEGVEVIVEPGVADLAVLRAAERWRADLIVVGRRGLGAVAGRLLGSVSRRVVEGAPCPVAVIPSPLGAHEGPVVVGVDGSASAAAAVEWATEVALALSSPMVVVHAVSYELPGSPYSFGDAMDRAGQAIAEEQSRPARDGGVEVRTVVRTLDPRALIPETADELDARLVVVGSRGAGPIASLLMGSTASFLAERCEHPTVLVPRPAS